MTSTPYNSLQRDHLITLIGCCKPAKRLNLLQLAEDAATPASLHFDLHVRHPEWKESKLIETIDYDFSGRWTRLLNPLF